MVQLTFHLEDSNVERLRLVAIDEGRTMSQVVRRALKAYFAELDKKKQKARRGKAA